MLLFVCVMGNKMRRELGDKSRGEGWALMDFSGKNGLASWEGADLVRE
jgi:hypothetical protein